MRKDFGTKTWLYPMPVLIIGTYDENNNPNAMNAAWGGIVDYGLVGVCLSDDHKTTKNILKQKAFTINIADAKHVVGADYVGIVSGNTEANKIAKANFTVTKSQFVNAPVIDTLPMALECEYVRTLEEGLVIGKIINVSADESVLSEKGSIDPLKLQPITYDPVNHKYITLGKIVGDAFEEGKKIK